jgi:hypothetical protein
MVEEVFFKVLKPLAKSKPSDSTFKHYKDSFAKVYQKCDQLHVRMKGKTAFAPFNLFKEGINNEGPMFLPTCRLKTLALDSSNGEISNEEKRSYGIDFHRSGADPDNYAMIKKGKPRLPSWCDRILYRTPLSNKGMISCMIYDRMDYGNTVYSDHAPVIGLYSVTSAYK